MFRKKKSLLIFLIPPLVGIAVFYVIPFLLGIRYSLTDGSYRNTFVGIQNYLNIWKNQMFLLGMKNTMELSLICVPLVWFLGFLIAAELNALRPGGSILRNSILLPYLMPSSAMLLVWLLCFDYGGVINFVVTKLGGGRVTWLSGSTLRLPVIMLFVWKNLGFAVVLFLTALQAIPRPLYEYATLEGASFLRRTFAITLPLITPTAFLVVIIEWINAFKIYREIYFIGGAYPDESVYTLQNYMNNMYTKLNYQNVTTAAYTLSVIVFILFGLMMLIENRIKNRIA